jgi:hypothetical protein
MEFYNLASGDMKEDFGQDKNRVKVIFDIQTDKCLLENLEVI